MPTPCSKVVVTGSRAGKRKSPVLTRKINAVANTQYQLSLDGLLTITLSSVGLNLLVLAYFGSIMTIVPTTERHMVLPNPKLVWSLARTSLRLRQVLGLIIVYFVVCKLGLRLAIIHPSATAVWPGTGIALAAILLLGYEAWPGVFLGAFTVNLTTAGSIISSLGIASGNTLEAVIGAYLVVRFANGRNVFNRAEGIFKFFFFACVAATTVSATLGTASLILTGFGRGVHWQSLWFTWWLGNMAGAILVTPCLILWSSQSSVVAGRSRRQIHGPGAHCRQAAEILPHQKTRSDPRTTR